MPDNIKEIISNLVDEFLQLETRLTLQQCYYYAVSRDHIVNSNESYKQFSDVWNEMQEDQHEQLNQA